MAPTELLSSVGWTQKEGKKKIKKRKRKKSDYEAATPKSKKVAAKVVVPDALDEAGHHWDDETGHLTISTKKASAENNLCIEGTADVRVIRGTAELLGHCLMEGDDTSSTLNCPSWSNPIAIDVSNAESESVVLQIRSNPPESKDPTFKLRSSIDVRPVAISNSWKSGCDTIFSIDAAPDEVQNQSSSRTLICGAKSTGKSTLLRYLVNRYLSNGKAVMILDCDVGQPECSTPGMLTLTLVQKPLLSPPHLHMNKDDCIKAYFYGHVTSRDDPPTYLEMITDLVASYTNYVAENHGGDEHDIPLVVNTDGWVKGFGFEILSTILQKVQPTFVMQLMSDLPARRFTLDDVLPKTSNFIPVDAYSLYIENPIPAQALRTLRTCTYFLDDDTNIWDRISFGQMGIVDSDCEIANTLAARKPRTVSIDSMRCHVVGFNQGDATALNVLNGSIVGLCIDQDGERYPSCVGLGIIRSIDRAKMLFYILTPVAIDKLAHVTAFVKGSLELPVECIYRGIHAEAFPYLSCRKKVEGLGGTVMKSRNNIGRK